MIDQTINKILSRTAIIYLVGFLTACLVLGIVHIFVRDVTLDNVRAIDFKVVQSALQNRSITSQEDREFITEITGNFAGLTGNAFYPLGVIDGNSCIENSSRPRICRSFPDIATLLRIKKDAEARTRFGVTVIRTDQGRHYLVGAVFGSDVWLVGSAGAYHFVGDAPFRKEVAFARNIGKVFSPYGLAKMAEKSIWTWTVTGIVFLVLWLVHIFALLRAERRHIQLTETKRAVELKLAEHQQKLTRLGFEKDKLEGQAESLADAKQQEQDEKELVYQELGELQLKISALTLDRDTLVSERDLVAKKLADNWTDRGSAQRRAEAERAFHELNEIKKLWLTDPDWPERYKIEGSLAAQSLGRAPFTEFIAFVRMEWLLKTLCERKGLAGPQSNEERIQALEDKGLISRKNASLLHDSRMARNRWFHEGHPPKPELMERLVRYLSEQRNPDVKPRI